jgi:hypothetical protein
MYATSIMITVIKDSGAEKGKEFKAFFNFNPEHKDQGHGQSREEAFGQLLILNAKSFNADISDETV